MVQHIYSMSASWIVHRDGATTNTSLYLGSIMTIRRGSCCERATRERWEGWTIKERGRKTTRPTHSTCSTKVPLQFGHVGSGTLSRSRSSISL